MVYKSRLYRIILNIIYGIFATIAAYFIATIWLEDMMPIYIAIGIFVVYIWVVVLDNFIKIEVDDTYLTVIKGKKTRKFEIEKCHFRATTHTSSGDTECDLYVIEEDGKETLIDCELIGIGQFQKLLDNLGITGDKAQAIKLQTKKGEK